MEPFKHNTEHRYSHCLLLYMKLLYIAEDRVLLAKILSKLYPILLELCFFLSVRAQVADRFNYSRAAIFYIWMAQE